MMKYYFSFILMILFTAIMPSNRHLYNFYNKLWFQSVKAFFLTLILSANLRKDHKRMNATCWENHAFINTSKY